MDDDTTPKYTYVFFPNPPLPYREYVRMKFLNPGSSTVTHSEGEFLKIVIKEDD